VKRLGESWISNLDKRGKTVRLWNIYGIFSSYTIHIHTNSSLNKIVNEIGHERHGLKSHVLTDWINGCLTDGIIQAQTDGTESRQFLHAIDTVAAMGTLMQHFDEIEDVTDISSNQWTTLRELATMITTIAPSDKSCTATWSTTHATARALIAPNTNTRLYSLWQPRITLQQGRHSHIIFILTTN
jgi:nucleoside-diphosphate-sugar epimerase